VRTLGGRHAIPSALAALFLLGLVLTSRQHFLLFHTLAELISIAIAGSIFVLAWNTRRFTNDSFLLVLGVAYLAVGAIDLVHALSYKGMGVFVGFDADLPTQLWIAGRYLQSVSMLLACAALRHRVRSGVVVLGYAAATGLLLALIFRGAFPECFIEGRGLTQFKVVSEYVICVVLLCGIVCMLRKGPLLDATVRRYVIAAIAFTIASELAFTLYVDVYGMQNLVGHLLKLVAFYLIYKAIIEGGVRRPYSLLFRDLKQSEEDLRRERDFASGILHTAGALIFVSDREGRIVQFNRACEELTGYREEEVRGQHYWDLVSAPEDLESRKRFFQERKAGEVRGDRDIRDYETVWVTRDGRRRDLIWSVSIHPDEEGQPDYGIAVGIDITERKQAERELRQLLDERELLLEEVHHRVKNNLQIVAGLLDLSRRQTDSEEAQQALGDAHSKVHAMGLIHEGIHRATRLDRVDLARYLRRLTSYLANAYGPEDRHITVAVEASEAYLPLTQAVPCGLIINELVTNAFQHAFAGRDRGEIRVQVTTAEDGAVTLVVRDDGIGMPAPSSGSDWSTLGVQLVRGLASQLEGTVEFATNGGTQVTLRFQREEPAGRLPTQGDEAE
jgi:PAS domain S-box-containing protein